MSSALRYPVSGDISNRFVFNAAQQIKDNILKEMGKKLCKDEYLQAYETHGPGILVLDIRDPLFTDTTLTTIQDWSASYEEEVKKSLSSRSPASFGFFKEVYIRYFLDGRYKFTKIFHSPYLYSTFQEHTKLWAHQDY